MSYRIKPLVFEENLNVSNRWTAKTPFGRFDITLTGGGSYFVNVSWMGREDTKFTSFENAERKANRIWKRHIEGCIE